MRTGEAALIPATEAHLREAAENMRPEDVAECAASHGMGPLEVLRYSASRSDITYAMVLGNGAVLAVLGVGPVPDAQTGASIPGMGVSWLLSTRLVDKHPKAFLRACLTARNRALEKYEVLTSLVDARYAKALRWLGWLGYEVHEARPYGAACLDFHPVVLRRDSWAA